MGLAAADRGDALGSSAFSLDHDRDSVHGRDFDARARTMGITGVQTPRRAPNANAIAERVVRSIRIECMDPLIVINDRHLTAVLSEFIDYYNNDRPHRSLALTSPVPIRPSREGPVTSRAVLGGLHHVYGRAAWSGHTIAAPWRLKAPFASSAVLGPGGRLFEPGLNHTSALSRLEGEDQASHLTG
jgi:hypothetical protein